MKFVCVTPCLNAGQYIKETVLSVLNQTALSGGAHSLIYLILDGGSEDDTKEIIENIADIYSDQEHITIRYASQKDKGMYDALARGFESDASGDVYSYINAGDYYSPYAFEIVSEIFLHHNIEFLTGMAVIYNEKSHLVRANLPYDYSKNLYRKGFYGTLLGYIQQESTFWAGSLQAKLDLDRLRKFSYAGDFYMWGVFISAAPLYIVSAWLGGFKVHENQLSVRHAVSYRSEAKSLSVSRNPLDYLQFMLFKLLDYLPNRLKIKVSSRIICFDHMKKAYVVANQR